MKYGPRMFPLAVSILINWHRPLLLLLGFLLLGWAFYDFYREIQNAQETHDELNKIKEMALELYTAPRAKEEGSIWLEH